MTYIAVYRLDFSAFSDQRHTKGVFHEQDIYSRGICARFGRI